MAWPRLVIVLGVSIVSLGLGGARVVAQVPLKDQPHLRRPVAATWIEEGKLLAVANERSGSVSIVDIEKRKVLTEVAVGEKLADVASLPSPDGPSRWLLAVDEKLHELLLLHWEADQLKVAERVPVSGYPVSIAVATNGSYCTVASLWSRTITTFDITPATEAVPPTLDKRGELPLPFAPRGQLGLPDNKHVLVTDAFTGQMAMVNVAEGSALKINAKRVFRIFGTTLADDGEGVRIAHQVTKIPEIATVNKVKAKSESRDLVNFVGQYSIRGLLQGRMEPYLGEQRGLIRFGYFPGDLRQVAEMKSGSFTPVQRGRVQVLDPVVGESQLFVRRFSDEVVVTDPDKPTKRTTISLGAVGRLTAVDRGEALFHDTSLSSTRWMSCHGCHPDGHTTGQLADTLGDNTKGTHKRVLTLLGAGSTGNWAWTGEVADLRLQVVKSLETTMGKPTNPQVVNDLTAYIQSLPPPPPRKPATNDLDDKAQLARGEILFRSRGCLKCHVPELGYTSDAVYDVGLKDEKGRAKFNPPSLRGVGHGYSFFHDGRATQLEDVFLTHLHPDGEELPAADVADLVRYLNSL